MEDYNSKQQLCNVVFFSLSSFFSKKLLSNAFKMHRDSSVNTCIVLCRCPLKVEKGLK